MFAAILGEHAFSTLARIISFARIPPRLWHTKIVCRAPMPLVGSRFARFLALSLIVSREASPVKKAGAG